MDGLDAWVEQELGTVVIGESAVDALAPAGALPDGSPATREAVPFGDGNVLVEVRYAPARPVKWKKLERALGPPTAAEDAAAFWCGTEAHPDLVVTGRRADEKVEALALTWVPALREVREHHLDVEVPTPPKSRLASVARVVYVGPEQPPATVEEVKVEVAPGWELGCARHEDRTPGIRVVARANAKLEDLPPEARCVLGEDTFVIRLARPGEGVVLDPMVWASFLVPTPTAADAERACSAKGP